MKKILFYLFVLCYSVDGKTQTLEIAIDSILNAKFKINEPGATALVSKNGQIIYRKAFGIANLELNVSMKPEMVFEIGSMTKQFTAISILMLEEQGKLSLNDELTKYIKDFPINGNKITIHHLLNHTSGIVDPPMLDWISFMIMKDFKPIDFIDLLKKQPLRFSAGDNWEYSNAGYFILGYIIERASGVSYEEFLNQNIFKPIEMKDTYCRINTSGNPIIKNKVCGYERNDSFVNAKYLDMAQPYSAGAILSSVDDLNKWNTALINDKLLRKETLAKAFFNYKLNNGENTNYGYGFLQNEIQGSPTIEHGGGIPGYASNAIYFPEEKVYVVILSNCRNNDPAYISIQIGALVVGKPIAEKQPLILSTDEIKKYEGKYLNLKDSISYLVCSGKGVLSIQRAEGGRRTTLIPYEKNKFFVRDSYNEYLFVPNKKSIYELIIKNRRRMQIEKCIQDWNN